MVGYAAADDDADARLDDMIQQVRCSMLLQRSTGRGFIPMAAIDRHCRFAAANSIARGVLARARHRNRASGSRSQMFETMRKFVLSNTCRDRTFDRHQPAGYPRRFAIVGIQTRRLPRCAYYNDGSGAGFFESLGQVAYVETDRRPSPTSPPVHKQSID